jgi:hypothetical protein
MSSEPGFMTPYQKLCEKFLLEMLNSYDSETLSQPAFKATAKSLIRYYPEFNMENENPYKVFDLYRTCFRFNKRGRSKIRLISLVFGGASRCLQKRQ